MFLNILQNLQENICARVSFLIKLQVAPATLLKKALWRRCFPVNFAKFLRAPFQQNTSGQRLLYLQINYDFKSEDSNITIHSLSLHKKWSLPLRIFSVNVTKSAGNCDLVTFTEETLNGKLLFFFSVSHMKWNSNLMTVLGKRYFCDINICNKLMWKQGLLKV